ncbi:MAG: hypothetical protein WBD31_32845 [Rubripirellula sp.]
MLKTVFGLVAAMLFAVNAQAGCGECGGCESGSGCVTSGGVAMGSGGGSVVYSSGEAGASMGGACGPSVSYETRTVMQSQYVTETQMVPTTSYQRQTQTRMRNVTRSVAKVQTRQQTYTVNVPQTQTRTE